MSSLNRIRSCQRCRRIFTPHPGAKGVFCSNYCKDNRKPLTMLEHFILNMSLPNENGCMIWAGQQCAHGYGRFGKAIKPHRFAWELANGPIPDGLQVLHRCDVRLCVNHRHLFVGTLDDNMKDMVSKGRQAKGGGVKSSKLTDKDVITLRGEVALGMTQREAARRYGVTVQTINRVILRQIWKHV